MDENVDGTVPLLDVQDLRVEFDTETGAVSAVDGVSLRVDAGRTVAIVGESGCGKSVTALSIVRLIPQPPGRVTGGRILLSTTANDAPNGESTYKGSPRGPGFVDSVHRAVPRGRRKRALRHAQRHPQKAALQQDLLALDDRDLCKIRGNRIAMIFQEPFVSLNPVYTVGTQIVEAIELHQPLRGKAARTAAIEMMRQVGIPAPAQRFRDYPHQMSGGMLQRVMIAMALSCRPSLLIADEPTTALDVTIQAQILELLRTLQAETHMSIIIITHDLGVVGQIADYVYVMYAGRIVEHAPTDALFADPLHPYTQGLLHCMPRLSDEKTKLDLIPGSVPDPTCFPPGCRFHPRCRRSMERAKVNGRSSIEVESSFAGPVLRRCVERCEDEPSGAPPLLERGPKHFVACWETSAP